MNSACRPGEPARSITAPNGCQLRANLDAELATLEDYMVEWFYADFVLCPIFESAAQIGYDRALVRLRNLLRVHGDAVDADTMRSAVGSYLTALVAGVDRVAALAAAFWELEDCPGRSSEWERLARHYDAHGCAFPWAPENAHIDIITRKTWPPLLMLRMQRK